jgi:hypothetical protein
MSQSLKRPILNTQTVHTHMPVLYHCCDLFHFSKHSPFLPPSCLRRCLMV